jgi:ABC-2 type transport system ATP-binding protein
MPSPRTSLHICDVHVLRKGFELTVDSVEFPAGVTLFVGPNGAGKTTLFDAITGAIRGISPKVTLGDDPVAPRAVGYMPQNPQLPADLSCRELLEHVAWLCGSTRPAAHEAAGRELDRVDLVAKEDVPAKDLSGGMKRRLAFACVTVRDSSALLLDEPTNDLDPSQRIRFLEIVQDVATTKPVVVSTHALHDFEGMPQQIIVLDQGAVLFSGATTAFLESFSPEDGDLECAYLRCLRHDASGDEHEGAA